MDTIRITLETLYDILRNEKKREDLQKLEETFFIDVVSYLREKQELLASKEKSDNIFASGEREKLEYELRSIKRILKEIYEKREKKILDITLNKSKTGSDLIDTSAMLREEKEMYADLLSTVNKYRAGILFHLFKGELPSMSIANRPAKKEVFAQFESKENSDADESNQNEDGTESNNDAAIMTKIRFLHPTPSFVWKDMKEYGPFSKGDETQIFPEVAELLVRKGRAEKV